MKPTSFVILLAFCTVIGNVFAQNATRSDDFESYAEGIADAKLVSENGEG